MYCKLGSLSVLLLTILNLCCLANVFTSSTYSILLVECCHILSLCTLPSALISSTILLVNSCIIINFCCLSRTVSSQLVFLSVLSYSQLVCQFCHTLKLFVNFFTPSTCLSGQVSYPQLVCQFCHTLNLFVRSGLYTLNLFVIFFISSTCLAVCHTLNLFLRSGLSCPQLVCQFCHTLNLLGSLSYTQLVCQFCHTFNLFVSYVIPSTCLSVLSYSQFVC